MAHSPGQYRCGRWIRRNHSGNDGNFKTYAHWHNRRFRHRARKVLREINSGDLDAAENFDRHYRHTADWEL